jgi:hypothetical protein
MKNHYVYKLIDEVTGEYYFGCRSTIFDPISDKYMGSPKVWKPNKSNLKKIIIKSDFKNRNDAILFESQIIEANINDPLNRNYHVPKNSKFSNLGFVTCYDTTTDKNLNVKVEEYYQNKNRYIPNAKKNGVGNKNSQHNTIWINDGKKQIKIKKTTTIPEGFYKGRLKYIWIHDPITSKNSKIIEGMKIPEGYVEGRFYKVKEETKIKLSKSLTGRKIPKEVRDKISVSHKSKIEQDRKLPNNKGKILLDEHKKKISDKMKKRWESLESRNIHSEIMKEYYTIKNKLNKQ